MREIKFRAWVKDNAMMFPWSIAILKHWHDFPEDIVLMQYTGLKDKNGREIYEGDILSGDNEWESGNGERLVITWDAERSRWDSEFYTIYGGEGHLCADENLTYRIKACGYVVIGNIYENQELLKETK